IYDVVRYRIHRAKKAIKDELDSRKEVMYLLCPNPHCKARYSTLDTDRLIDPVDFNLKCERCHSELEAESDMLGGGGGGGGVDGEDNTRKKKKEALQNMLARFEVSGEW
ncbi:unnamed protein product, partial [Closterium sp. NIES-53]